MPNYIGDDVIPSFLGANGESFYDGDFFSNDSLRVGQVIEVIYPQDKRSYSQQFIEYNVLVQHFSNNTTSSKVYNNCTVMNSFASFADKSTFTLRTNQDTSQQAQSVGYGSKVLILCINGQPFNGIIIGGIRDDKDVSEQKYSKDNNPGKLGYWLFNGIKASINNDGELTVTYNGATKNDGSTDVPESQSGTTVVMSKDGNLSIQDRDSKNQILLNHADSKIENKADVEWNTSSNGNNVKLNSDGITATDSAQSTVTLPGDGTANVQALNIHLNGQVSVGPEADSFMIRGTETVAILSTLNAAIMAYIQGIQPTADPMNTYTPILAAALTAATTALATTALSKGNNKVL